MGFFTRLKRDVTLTQQGREGQVTYRAAFGKDEMKNSSMLRENPALLAVAGAQWLRWLTD